MTIADARPRLRKAGKMPHRGKKAHFQRWLDRLQSDESLLADEDVFIMWLVLNSLSKGKGFIDIVYLTGRCETYRKVTEEWLKREVYPEGRLIMRKKTDWRSARGYKEAEVKKLVKKYGTGVVFDDDSEGDCSSMYTKHGLVHLKVFLPKENP